MLNIFSNDFKKTVYFLWHEKCFIHQSKQSLVLGIRIGCYFDNPNSVLTMEKIDNDIIMERLISLDNGGRRSGGDRRNYSYTLHIPERRSGKDRRSGTDRRKIPRTKAKPRN